jgi:hypothetical protein
LEAVAVEQHIHHMTEAAMEELVVVVVVQLELLMAVLV